MALLPASLTLQKGTDAAKIDAQGTVEHWFSQLELSLKAHQISGLDGLFVPECWWKDTLALSWDFRALHTVPKIEGYLGENLPGRGFLTFKVPKSGATSPKVMQRGPMAWIESLFEFETNIGRGSGVLRLANTKPGEWKSWCISTWLSEIKGSEEKVGLRRPNGVTDAIPRQPKAQNGVFPKDKTVLIIGAGRTQLSIFVQRSNLYQGRLGWRLRLDYRL